MRLRSLGSLRIPEEVCLSFISAQDHACNRLLHVLYAPRKRLSSTLGPRAVTGMRDAGYELPRIPVPRTRVNRAENKPQTTLAVASFGLRPYRLVPGVPSNRANTRSTIVPISGTRTISIHQPDRSMSWSLLTVTARLGMMTARP